MLNTSGFVDDIAFSHNGQAYATRIGHIFCHNVTKLGSIVGEV